jgi:hypothetical protein
MKLTQIEILALAKKVAWTPCRHYQQCIGYCPICFYEYLEGKHETTIKPETATS